MKYTKDYLAIKKLINDADAIVLGLGSGMSAAGGLNYADKELFKKLYTDFYEKGYTNILHAQSNYWPNNIDDYNCFEYWRFWCRHIYNVRFRPGITQPYALLKEIIEHKPHYVITTNCDGQSQKTFKDVYYPQGDYSYLQCKDNCSNKVYYNEDFILQSIEELVDIPRCENCGGFLIPNLRCDDSFCEAIGRTNMQAYINFINKYKEQKILLIEIGVGYNTPGIIRYPFDQMVEHFTNCNLIRINKEHAEVPGIRSIGIKEDIMKVLKNIK